MPTLYLITGANGAGKSTIGSDYLPEHIRNNYTAFDGDKLYKTKLNQLWPEQTKSLKEAKKIAAAFIEETLEKLLVDALNNQDNFVYEGHFPSYRTWDFPKRFKENGYTIHMLFLGLTDINISEMRVGIRVKKGGHSVAKWDIENNFYGNLEMLNEHFQLLDYLQIMDTSFFTAKLIAIFKGINLITSILADELPEWFKKYLPLLTAQIFAVKP